MCVCVTSVVREWLKHGTDLGEHTHTHTQTHTHTTHTHDVILGSISYGMCKWEGLCLCVMPVL